MDLKVGAGATAARDKLGENVDLKIELLTNTNIRLGYEGEYYRLNKRGYGKSKIEIKPDWNLARVGETLVVFKVNAFCYDADLVQKTVAPVSFDVSARIKNDLKLAYELLPSAVKDNVIDGGSMDGFYRLLRHSVGIEKRITPSLNARVSGEYGKKAGTGFSIESTRLSTELSCPVGKNIEILGVWNFSELNISRETEVYTDTSRFTDFSEFSDNQNSFELKVRVKIK